MFDDLGPILETGSRLSIILATVVVAIRLLNTTFNNSQSSWEQTAAMLTETADYAKTETSRLRDRVTALETEALQHAEDRANWLTERAALMSRITHLESEVERLTTKLHHVQHRDTGELP